ncbi:MAG TPA: 3-deoxy-7-phosphoheptulonate synthase [Candidatus Saccharimonadales bacterium]|jgi:3-deoxy-7-phosphoheptulonate synthase
MSAEYLTVIDQAEQIAWELAPPSDSEPGEPAIIPQDLLRELPMSETVRQNVEAGRSSVIGIMNGEDDRLVVHMSGCSVHDPKAAIAYSGETVDMQQKFEDYLVVVNRAYWEKPRTITGWEGAISDPGMDGSYRSNMGLVLARATMLAVAAKGMPIAYEILEPHLQPYFGDVISHAMIGARTTLSQLHRNKASDLAIATGFKNTTAGNILETAQSVLAAQAPHRYLVTGRNGEPRWVTSSGNPYAHIVLRGGHEGPNYTQEHIQSAIQILKQLGLPKRLMVDASHGNSGKDHRQQSVVVDALADQMAAGVTAIRAVALETTFKEGRQEPGPNAVPEQSVTDACAGLEQTWDMLGVLAEGVRRRREMVDR